MLLCGQVRRDGTDPASDWPGLVAVGRGAAVHSPQQQRLQAAVPVCASHWPVTHHQGPAEEHQAGKPGAAGRAAAAESYVPHQCLPQVSRLSGGHMPAIYMCMMCAHTYGHG